MTGREQLRIISCALPKMIDKLASSNARHYNAVSESELSSVRVHPAKLD
jgi:hypothetical protein